MASSLTISGSFKAENVGGESFGVSSQSLLVEVIPRPNSVIERSQCASVKGVLEVWNQRPLAHLVEEEIRGSPA